MSDPVFTSKERIAELLDVIDMIAFNCPTGVVEFKVTGLMDLKDEIDRLTAENADLRLGVARMMSGCAPVGASPPFVHEPSKQEQK